MRVHKRIDAHIQTAYLNTDTQAAYLCKFFHSAKWTRAICTGKCEVRPWRCLGSSRASAHGPLCPETHPECSVPCISKIREDGGRQGSLDVEADNRGVKALSFGIVEPWGCRALGLKDLESVESWDCRALGLVSLMTVSCPIVWTPQLCPDDPRLFSYGFSKTGIWDWC